jgi:hypothetical protein
VFLIYVPGIVHLWRYQAGIRRIQEGGGLPALEDALTSQKSFWRYVGILAVVVMSCYAAIFVVMVVAGAIRR